MDGGNTYLDVSGELDRTEGESLCFDKDVPVDFMVDTLKEFHACTNI